MKYSINISLVLFLLQPVKHSTDVDGIMYVINLDFPKLIEDYVHRIGRCGRCDRMGISYAFFTLNDAKQAKELIAILNEANQPVDAKLQEIAFNPKKPEKIDKKQRRLNENSGFSVDSLPEKRRHDDRNVNFSDAGPSSSTARNTYMGEPERKRERIVEPEPPELSYTFNRNNDRDFMDERNINRGFMDIPSTVSNLDRVDDRNIGLRQFEDRNVDRFQSDDRDLSRDIVRDRDIVCDRGIVRDLDIISDRDIGRDRDIVRDRELIRDRAIDRELLKDELTSRHHLIQRQRVDFDRNIEERARVQQRPVNLLDDYRMAGEGSNDFRRSFPMVSSNFDRSEPSIGLNRMRNILETRFDQRESEFARMDDFRDRLNDRLPRDYLDDVQRPIRDNLLDGRDHDINRSGPMFNSSVSDRRNYERESIDVRDTFSTKAANFQNNLNSRSYDALPERRGTSQEFRLSDTPDPILDRSDLNASRFLNQSRNDEPIFDSLHQFGIRRGGDIRERTHNTRFDLDDIRNDFTDEISQNQPNSSRWNDFSSRDVYSQDRRDFSNDMELRRRNDFSVGGEMNINFSRNNDFDDDFRNPSSRDFDRRNINDRFNRFN